MEIDKKYEQWKAITESDFVTLFIKTWFTFIAILREINPDVNPFTDEGVPRGDKPFLNAYKNGIMPIVQKELSIDYIVQELSEMYPISMNKVMEVFPQYFFQTFFKVNDDFNYEDEFVNPDKYGKPKERYRLSLKIVDRYNLKFHLGISGYSRTKDYNESINKKINLKKIINSVVQKYRNRNAVFDELGFIRDIDNEILAVIIKIVSDYNKIILPNRKYNSTVNGKIKDSINHAITTLRIKLEYNYRYPHQVNALDDLNSYTVVFQEPYNGFGRVCKENVYQNNKDFYNQLVSTKGIEWFANYVYSLRNALFHEIISPLDEEWQTIFKSSYLILKQISDICIYCISNLNEMFQDQENIIINYICNNQTDLFSSLADFVELLDFYEMSLDKYKISNGKFHLQGTFTVILKLQNGTAEEIEKGIGDIIEARELYRYEAYLDNLSAFSVDENGKERISIKIV